MSVNNNRPKLGGVVVPMITPLDEKAEIDVGGVERLVEFLIGAGVHGLFPLGSSGEFVVLSHRKRKRLLETVIQSTRGRIPVCAGISSNCLDEVIEAAEEAAKLGADVGVMLTPFYFRVSQAEMLDFFTTAAGRSPIPLVAYNIPFRTNNSIEPETVEQMSHHPNIIGVKDTISDMARTLNILERLRGREDFSYMQGSEPLIIPSLLFGAKGFVASLANFAPEFLVAVHRAASNRDASGPDMDALPAMQARIAKLTQGFSLLESKPRESTALRLQAIKMVLEEMGICRNYMAQIDIRPDEAARRRVVEFMAQNDLQGDRFPKR